MFCCSISISMTSFSVVSLIAMVPESECRMPTLMVPPVGAAAWARAGASWRPCTAPTAATVAAATPSRPRLRRDMLVSLAVIVCVLFPVLFG